MVYSSSWIECEIETGQIYQGAEIYSVRLQDQCETNMPNQVCIY